MATNKLIAPDDPDYVCEHVQGTGARLRFKFENGQIPAELFLKAGFNIYGRGAKVQMCEACAEAYEAARQPEQREQVYSVRTRGGSWGITLNVLETIRGLSIKYPKNAVKILAACQQRLTESGTSCVYLYFDKDKDDQVDGGYDHIILVEKDETLESLKAKFKSMQARGYSKILACGS
jgi:hypothetical protein